MLTYADALSDFRYEQGLVSFRLHRASADDHGDLIHIPFEDFCAISTFLAGEAKNVAPVHIAWLQEQIGRYSFVEVEALHTKPRLGRKIASV